MTMTLARKLPAICCAATMALFAACSADTANTAILDPTPVASAVSLSVVGGTTAGAFANVTAPSNAGRAVGAFWDNTSADFGGVEQCNIGWFATGQLDATCINQTAGTFANQGGFAGGQYFGDAAGNRDATAFMFGGATGYTVTLKGSIAGGVSEVGWFTKSGGVYSFNPVADWSAKVINTSVNINTGGADWGFYIRNDFNPSVGGCSGADTDCSDAEGGFTAMPFQQFALFINAAGSAYLVGAEDNKLELLPNGAQMDSDYNDYIWSVIPNPCDFITFGRLVTEDGGTKVVISGNAGGNRPGGGILGEFHIDVNGTDYHVSDIASYGPIGAGPLSGLVNSRVVTGTARNGAAVELRLWDGGEPGKNTDRVYVKINGSVVLSATGQTIDQGNMQYHPVCRGPG
jgi:hypothetical protein